MTKKMTEKVIVQNLNYEELKHLAKVTISFVLSKGYDYKDLINYMYFYYKTVESNNEWDRLCKRT